MKIHKPVKKKRKKKSAIEIDEMENIQDNFIVTFSFFNGTKQISYGDLKWKMLTSFFHSEVTWNVSHNLSTQHLGLLQCKTPVGSFIFSSLLKPDRLEGVRVSKENKVFGIFHTYE